MSPNFSIESHGASTIGQINGLLAQSQQSLLCGPDCQKQKNIDDLKKKYENAIANVNTAPQQLTNAKKNYFTALEGTAAYNKDVLADVTATATQICNVLQKNFDASAKTTSELIDTYQSLETNYNYMKELSNTYAEENTQMANRLKKIRGDIMTNDRKTFYEQQHLSNLLKWYNIIRLIYIVILIAFIINVIMKMNGIIIKILVILFFIFYPIFITSLVIYIIDKIKGLIYLLPKNVYTSI